MTKSADLKDFKEKIKTSSRLECMQILHDTVIELNKLLLVHGLKKLKDTSLISKTRYKISFIYTILSHKHHA